MKKKRVMIVFPIGTHRKISELEDIRDRTAKYLQSKGYMVYKTLLPSECITNKNVKMYGVDHVGILYLGKVMSNVMCQVDAVYFCKGWHLSHDFCCVIHEVAKQYGLELLYEKGAEEYVRREDD